MRRPLIQTTAFVRSAKRFIKKQPAAAAGIREALTSLEQDAFDPRLRTHKLKGDMSGYWASSAAYDLRIVFQFVKQGAVEAILLVSVGTHDEVY